MAPHANAQERWGQALSLLDLAEERLPSDLELFKAVLISAIVLGDSVRDLIHVQDARVPGFKFWEDQLEQRWPSLPTLSRGTQLRHCVGLAIRVGLVIR